MPPIMILYQPDLNFEKLATTDSEYYKQQTANGRFGEDTHKHRAEALQRATPGSACRGTHQEAIAVKGLNTLCFWGHGTEAKFCGLQPDGFVELIRQWKALNKDIKTIEVITCNARHTHKGDGSGTFLKRTLSLIRRRHKGRLPYVMKSMAVGVGGGIRLPNFPQFKGLSEEAKKDIEKGAKARAKTKGALLDRHTHSILLWSSATLTWCYITAPSKTGPGSMFDGKFTVSEASMKCNSNLILAAKKVAKEKPDRLYTLTCGTVGELRRQLRIVN